MPVVSPITAVVAAALPVAAGVARGDALRWFQSAGIAIAAISACCCGNMRKRALDDEAAALVRWDAGVVDVEPLIVDVIVSVADVVVLVVDVVEVVDVVVDGVVLVTA